MRDDIWLGMITRIIIDMIICKNDSFIQFSTVGPPCTHYMGEHVHYLCNARNFLVIATYEERYDVNTVPNCIGVCVRYVEISENMCYTTWSTDVQCYQYVREAERRL